MNVHPSRLAKVAASTALAGTMLLVAGCGQSLDDAGSSTDAQPKKQADLAKLLPASIRDKGTITVAAAVYAPAVMTPPAGGEPTGWDIENTRQAASLLGLKVKFKVIPFDGVVPGLQAGRFDAATGEIYVTAERTKTVTFVVNHVSKDEFLVPADSKHTSFAQESDVCGLVIGAQLGSAEADSADKLAAKCNKSGAKKTTVKTFADQATVALALTQGRVDINLASGSQAAYTADKSNGKLKVAKMGFGDQVQTGLALARNKDTAQLAKAFEAATNELIKTGALQKILDKYNGGLGAVDKSEIVPAPTS